MNEGFGVGDPSADMRQGFYYHVNKIRMQISIERVKGASQDVEGLLNWCSLLYELYTLMIAFIPKEDIEYFEKLADIEDSIIRLSNKKREMKSNDESIKLLANKDFITYYSKIQKALHDRQKKLYYLMTKRNMVLPIEDTIDPFEKWALEAGADPDEVEENEK